MEGYCGVYTRDLKVLKGGLHKINGFRPILSLGNKLCEERIIVRWNKISRVAVGVDPDTGAFWGYPLSNPAGTGLKACVWRLGVDAAFDRMPI